MNDFLAEPCKRNNPEPKRGLSAAASARAALKRFDDMLDDLVTKDFAF